MTNVQVTQYIVTELPLDHPEIDIFSLTVAWCGQPWNAPPTDRQWAVRRHANAHPGRCLSRTGVWRWEPQPSERTPTFYKRHRFTLDEALDAALREVVNIRVNGNSAADALANYGFPNA